MNSLNATAKTPIELSRKESEHMCAVASRLIERRVAVAESRALQRRVEEAVAVADWLRDYISFDAIRTEYGQLVSALETLSDHESIHDLSHCLP